MELGPKRLTRFFAGLSIALLCVATTLHAGIGGVGRRSVGGVMIDGKGVVRAATIEEQKELGNLVKEMTAPAAGDLAAAADM